MLFQNEGLRYELKTHASALGVRIPRKTWEWFARIVTHEAWAVADASRQFSLPAYVNPHPTKLGAWGFGGCVTLVTSDDAWTEWKVALPQAIRARTDWPRTNAFCLTLYIMYTALRLEEAPSVSADLQQVMYIDLFRLQGDLNAFPIGAHLTPTAYRWLKSGAQELPEVTLTMARAYAAVSGRTEDTRRFSAHVTENGGFFLDCPGDACDLGTLFELPDAEHWVELNCHNVDGPEQQIAFLMGLARLHELIRASQGAR